MAQANWKILRHVKGGRGEDNPVHTVDVVSIARDGETVTGDRRSLTSIDELPRASIIIVSYNGRRFLGKCLASVLQQNYPNYEVLVVDNASSDGSVEFVEQEFSTVRVIRNETNLGFGGANNVGASRATGEYLAFLNQDTVVEPDWLAELLTPLEEDPEAALATSKILLMAQPDKINTCGNQTHYTGLSFCRGVGQPADNFDQLEIVDAVAGAAFLIRKSVFEKIGRFDERFFLYMEDIDLSWRARLAGYTCLYVPNSVIYHEYALTFGPDKSFYQERNRWLMLLKCLRWPTLLLLSPALLLSELISWGWVLLWDTANVGNKARAYWWLLRSWRKVIRARDKVQGRRCLDDRELIAQCGCHLAYDQLAHGPIVRAAQAIFDPLLDLLQRSCTAIMWW